LRAHSYSATETLRDGARLEIRALTPADRDGLLAAAGRASERTMVLRFFAPKHGFSEKELEYYTAVDFESHVALVGLLELGARPLIVAGGRYIVARPGCAEVAFGVEDAHQGRGIAAALLRHLATIARAAGLDQFLAEVLAENTAMLKVFERSGFAMTTKREREVVHVALRLEA